jgi:hypothetical protein
MLRPDENFGLMLKECGDFLAYAKRNENRKAVIYAEIMSLG